MSAIKKKEIPSCFTQAEAGRSLRQMFLKPHWEKEKKMSGKLMEPVQDYKVEFAQRKEQAVFEAELREIKLV